MQSYMQSQIGISGSITALDKMASSSQETLLNRISLKLNVLESILQTLQGQSRGRPATGIVE